MNQNVESWNFKSQTDFGLLHFGHCENEEKEGKHTSLFGTA